MMGAGHDHSTSQTNERALWWALGLTSTYLVAEVIGGLLTHSLALLSDAAHMLSDVVGLLIALAAMRIARRVADRRRTFGYYRFEILAAAFNATVLVVIAAYILWEAYQRFRNPPDIQSIGMMLVAIIGLLVNLASMYLLQSGRDRSLNVKGAYLEVWSDMVGSIGVIVAAIIIHFTQWAWLDAVVAAGIGLWVLPRAWLLLKESLNVLLEGIPEGVSLDAIEAALLATAGVAAIHDLHVWALTSGKNSLTVHVVLAANSEDQSVLQAVRESLAEKFGIHHSTVQIEAEACDDDKDGVAHFADAHASHAEEQSHTSNNASK